MSEPSIDIDRVVREVLAALGVGLGSRAPAAEKARAGDRPDEALPPTEEGRAALATSGQEEGALVLPGRLVSMSELEGRLEGIRRLVISPQAVVTPLVRDELRRRNISLVRSEPAPARSAAGSRLVMMVLGSRFDPLPLARAFHGEGIEVQTRHADCPVAATDQLAGEVAQPNTLGLVVTTDPAVALCLANRHRRVRAVMGLDAATLSADAASVGANVLVVNPRAASLIQMKQMASRFCREGPRQCPESLRERLG